MSVLCFRCPHEAKEMWVGLNNKPCNFAVFEGISDRAQSAHTESCICHRVKGRATLIKLKYSECNTCRRERKATLSPSLQTCLNVLFPLFCLFSLSLRHVYISHRRKQTETIKPSLLGNGSCVLHRRLTPPPPPPTLARFLWKHAIKRQCVCLSGWNESLTKPVDPGQSEAARATEGKFSEPIPRQDQEDRD